MCGICETCPGGIGIGGRIGIPLAIPIGPASPGGAMPIGGTIYIALPIGYTRDCVAAP